MIKESAVFLAQNIDEKWKDDNGNEAKICVWNMGSVCEGRTNARLMFSGQLSIPVCDRHYIEHVMLMAVRNLCDLDVENLVEAPDWSRVEMFNQEFGAEALTPEICRELLRRVRGGDKDSVKVLSDIDVVQALIEELPL